MPVDWHGRVISRLRAYQLIPSGVPAQLVVTAGGLKEGEWRWRLADAAGRDLGVGSRYGICYLARQPHWRFCREPGGLHIQPREARP